MSEVCRYSNAQRPKGFYSELSWHASPAKQVPDTSSASNIVSRQTSHETVKFMKLSGIAMADVCGQTPKKLLDIKVALYHN